MKQLKKLVILDLDDTQFPALTRLDKCLSQLMSDFAKVRGIDISHVKTLVRDAHGQHRFNDGAGLIDAIVTACPHISFRNDWKEADNRIKSDWIHRSQDLTVFYHGVLESLKYWKSMSVRTVVQTDCEDIAAIRNLWMLGANAHAQGQLISPFDILDFYDMVYCQQGIEPSTELVNSMPRLFYEQAKNKLHIWNDGLYKPAISHIEKILKDANVTPEQTLYIGDSHKDGIEATFGNVDFVWARYGTHIPQSTLDICSCVASRSFIYGEAAISGELNNKKIKPVTTLDTTMAHVLLSYNWTSPHTQPV